MKADIIIGANLGDEGKGTVVATIAKHSKGKTLNILTNGGSQRAHSILTEVGNFTFQHFGSGTYHGAYSYFSKYFIINPMQYVKELGELRGRGVEPYAIRDKKCRWSTPFDMMANAITEDVRGDKKHGSCGMGIWETVLRYNQTELTVDFDMFMRYDYHEKTKYLKKIKDYYTHNRLAFGIPKEWLSLWNNPVMIHHFIDDCVTMYNHTGVGYDTVNFIKSWKIDNLIFENGQGLLLCDQGKDVAGTTPSQTGCDYASEIITDLRLNGLEIETNLHYVTRPYLTRHGRGVLTTEMSRTLLSSDVKEDRTNHYNHFQEGFRYGEITAETMNTMHEYIHRDAQKMQNSKIIIDLTHCDEMDKVADFKKLFGEVNTYDSPLIK